MKTYNESVFEFVRSLRASACEQVTVARREDDPAAELIALSTKTTCDVILSAFDAAGDSEPEVALASEMVQ